MKKILILCAAVLVAGIGYTVWHYAQPEHYGHPFEGAKAASIHELIAQSGDSSKENVRIEGKIVRQCPASGCWFYLDDGKGSQVRVEMENVTPLLPQKVGRQAIVEGSLVMMGDEPVLAGNGVEFK